MINAKRGAACLIALFLVLLCGGPLARAQNGVPSPQRWAVSQEGFDNPFPQTALAVDVLGNVYHVGTAYPDLATRFNYVISKRDPAGNLLWRRVYDTPPANFSGSDDIARALAVDRDGNVYVTGSSPGANTVKYDTNGNLLWARRTYQGSLIAVDAAGNVFISGSVTNGPDIVVVKYTTSGDLLWTRQYNGTGNGTDIVAGIAVDGAGSVVVVGRSYGGDPASGGTGDDAVILKYAADGDSLWTRRFNGPSIHSGDFAEDVALDNDGNVYVAGSSSDIGTHYDYVTIKYDGADGTPLWVRRYNGPGSAEDRAHSLALDGENNVFVTGESFRTTAFGSQDYATIKYDRDGTLQWEQRYNGPIDAIDAAAAIAVNRNGDVYVTGNSGGFIGYDYATIKYDGRSGAAIWLERFNSPQNHNDVATQLVLDPLDNVYVTGWSFPNSTSPSNLFTVKYAGFDWLAVDTSVSADNKTRLLWNHRDGRAAFWAVDAIGHIDSTREYGPYPEWRAVALAGGAADNRTRLLWTRSDGGASVWTVDTNGNFEDSREFGPYPGWTCSDVAVGADDQASLLWNHADGRAALWTLTPSGSIQTSSEFGPYPGWRGKAIAATGDGRTRLLWNHSDGTAALWTVTRSGTPQSTYAFGPFPGWSCEGIGIGPNNGTRLFWNHVSGATAIWSVSENSQLLDSIQHGPFPDWTGTALGVSPSNNKLHLLWNNSDGPVSLWLLSTNGAFDSAFAFGPY